MRNHFLRLIYASMIISLFALSSAQAKEFDLCDRYGTLRAKYFDEAPQRIVIYDANYDLIPSAPIFRVHGNKKSKQYERVSIDALEVGSILSYKVDPHRAKRKSRIEAIWILPSGHCQSSE